MAHYDAQGLMTTTNNTKIHKTALVSEKAEIGTGVEIGPYSIIGDDVQIGNDTIVGRTWSLKVRPALASAAGSFSFALWGQFPKI